MSPERERKREIEREMEREFSVYDDLEKNTYISCCQSKCESEHLKVKELVKVGAKHCRQTGGFTCGRGDPCCLNTGAVGCW